MASPVELQPVLMWTQGDHDSWHATAGSRMMAGNPYELMPCENFSGVIAGTKEQGGLGVVAINTVAGTAEASAKQIARDNPDVLPHVIRREDVSVELALQSNINQTPADVIKRGTALVIAQEEAWIPCKPKIEELFEGRVTWSRRSESTVALNEVRDTDNPNMLALGPSFAAKSLGLSIVGPRQMAPEGSITSFYGLQRDPREVILPPNAKMTDEITVLRLRFPFQDITAMTKVMAIMERDDINLADRILRAIPFRRENLPLGGGSEPRFSGIFFEIRDDPYSREIYRLMGRVAKLPDDTGNTDGVTMVRLGSYPWYPKEQVDLTELVSHFAVPAQAVTN